MKYIFILIKIACVIQITWNMFNWQANLFHPILLQTNNPTVETRLPIKVMKNDMGMF